MRSTPSLALTVESQKPQIKHTDTHSVLIILCTFYTIYGNTNWQPTLSLLTWKNEAQSSATYTTHKPTKPFLICL